jgi:hypothetical protein
MKSRIAVVVSICLIYGLASCGGGKAVKTEESQTLTIDEKKGKVTPTRGRAKGVAAIFDNDKALARDRAINDARNKLVEQVLGATISGQSVMKDFELVSMLVESRSYGLVKDEKIVDEKSDADMYTVEIEGTVEQAAVEDAIESALNRYGRPKFMVLINETFEGKTNMPGSTETEYLIQEKMGNSGFQFVDIKTVKDLMRKQRAKMNMALNGEINPDVQNLLLDDQGAEVIVVGTAQTKDQSEALRGLSKNMKSKSAIIRLKAIDLYTGRILATTSRNAPGVHIESDTASKKAIENVIRLVLGDKNESTGKFKIGPFMDEIIRQFVKAATHRQINLAVRGLDYNGLKKFRDQVQNRIRGVQQVLDKGRSGTAAKVEVYFAGTTNEFLDELKAKSDKMGFAIEIPENFPNRATISAKLIDKK